MASEGSDQKKEKKAPKEGIVIPPKKPKLSKAERRALQEAQRAAKGLKANGQSKSEDKQIPNKDKENNQTSKQEILNEKKIVLEKASSGDDKNMGTVDRDKTPNFFSHLPPFKGESFVNTICVFLNYHTHSETTEYS
jgi:hypothetical protein